MSLLIVFLNSISVRLDVTQRFLDSSPRVHLGRWSRGKHKGINASSFDDPLHLNWHVDRLLYSFCTNSRALVPRYAHVCMLLLTTKKQKKLETS